MRRALGAVRIPVYRACLTTIYACGLRLLEGARLQIPDIDTDRMLLHIHGKGKKDRYVPLPEPTLQMLRAFWRTHHSPVWLFPAPTRHGLAHSLAHNGGLVTRTSLHSAFHRSPRGLDAASGGHHTPPWPRVSRPDGQVTFHYRDNHTQRLRRATLPAMEFIGRFLQHVLPPGCTKVGYYGLWSNSCRRQLAQARALLDAPPCACAAVSSCAVPRHATRAISTLLQPPGAHRRLCTRPGHLPDGAKIHPAV